MASPEETLQLQLGDIIQIDAPTNDKYNDKVYLITYIDSTQIEIQDITSLKKTSLVLTPEGEIEDESIDGISLLSRAEEEGYARQNGLLPKTWVTITLGGDLPAIFTGEITNLEEDMIEVQTYPEKDTIYIDFGFKGIPKDIPITKIETRDPPALDIIELTGTERADRGTEGEERATHPAIKQQIREFIVQADQIVIGKELGEITQTVAIDEGKERYGIQSQTNDLLDELLATIPNAERTNKVMNNIHLMIERFKQLRTHFSDLDVNGNPIMPSVKGATHRPLIAALRSLNKKLAWILPVVKNKKILYDLTDEEAETVDDIVPKSTAEMLQEETIAYENYESNTVTDTENKYSFLLDSVDELGNPYVAPEGGDDDFLTEQNVETNFNVLVDNLEDFLSSVVNRETLARKQYLMTTYNLGFNKLQTIVEQGAKPYNKMVEATKGNKVYLKSMVLLPEEAIRYSRVGLPGTSILVSSALNRQGYSYYKRFKKGAGLETQEIQSFDEPMEYKFVNQATEIILDDELMSDGEKYEKYLNAIIPKTKALFGLIKKYINEKLTLGQVVKELEPFLVYTDDLTYQQYREMVRFIQNKINEYKKMYVERSREFRSLQSGKKFADRILYSLFEILGEHRKEVLEQGYKTRMLGNTSSENYNKIMQMDSGRLFMTTIALENLLLMTPLDINEIFEREKMALTDEELANPQPNPCAKFVLAKKYMELDELLDDNGKSVYFDKNLDQTRYDIIEEYGDELATMDPDDFQDFLKEALIKNVGLSEESAEKDAIAMILGKREVSEGEYASLQIDGGEKTYYYKRTGNVWERDESIPDIAMDENTFCNIQQDCVKTENECATEPIASKETREAALNSMIKEFDIKYEVSKGEMERMIQNRFEYFLYQLKMLKKLEINERYKYNNIQYTYGIQVEEKEPVAVSPYTELRDMILGQYDIVKKNNDIVKFYNAFLRAAGPGEDEHWLYCKESGLKLLPVFLFTLANTFIQDQYNYVKVLDRICANQGKLSDDGDSWVDEHSGYVIKKIAFDTDEGYEATGFKAESREVLLDELQATRSSELEKKYSDPRAESISNVIGALAGFMGFLSDELEEFVIRNTLLVTGKIVPSEREYNKKRDLFAKKGKKLPEFEDAYNQTMMLVTLSYFAVGIQLSIPSIRTKKQFPGCRKSFEGFPLEGSDDSGLLYVACVANKIKSKVRPWNTLSKLNATGIVKRMRDIITKYIIPDTVVETRIREKLEYLKLKTGDEIPVTLDIAKWQTFLPPLVPIKTHTIEGVSDDFKEAFIRHMRSGKTEQHTELLELRSKMIHYSMKIIQDIQQEVIKELPILTSAANEAFLENACCFDERQRSTIEYFMDKIPELRKINQIVAGLASINWDIYTITLAPKMFSPIDTRRVYPPLSNQFSEKTVYQAIIHYCQFGNSIPIPENLLPVCLSKPEGFSLFDPIKTQIKKLREAGKEFTLEDLQRLLTIVQKENEVNIPIYFDTKTTLERLRAFLPQHEMLLKDPVLSALIPLMDTFDISVVEESDEMKMLINVVDEANTRLKTDIISFLQRNSKLPRRKFEALVDFFRNTSWNGEADTDEGNIRAIDFMKTVVRNLTQVFPNIVLNQVDYDNTRIPKHWKISKRHEMDVKNIIHKYYESLSKYYGDEVLELVLTGITEKTQIWRDLMEKLPIFEAVTVKKIHASITPAMIKDVMEHILLQCYMQLISAAEAVVVPVGEESELTLEEVTTTEEVLNEELGNITEMDIISGERLQRDEIIAAFLLDVTQIFNTTKRQLNYSYADISYRVNVSKEKEKSQFTARLKQLSDEEREAENILKGHKLERWSKGLSKGVTQYVRDTYDEEREDMERQIAMERELGKSDFVSDMNRDIYMLEAMDEAARAAAIETEESRIEYMGEDADYEEMGMDGDEIYY